MTEPNRSRRLDEAVARYLTAEGGGTPLTAEEWLAAEPDLRAEKERFLANRRHLRAVVEAVATPDDAGFEPGAEFDGLRVVRFLHAGGMGRVYEGVQAGLDRPVAVKAVTAAGAGGGFGELLRSEVRVLGKLEHPHVVPVYGCGERAGRPYLVMGLMAGSLRDELAAGPLLPRRAAEVVRAVARGVQFAHDQGFLHRDIKPGNVLLDAAGTARLGDFGLVARVGAGGGRAGTPGYMAPEQWAAPAAVDERTDVYGLGAVLLECLTGACPGLPPAAGWKPPPEVKDRAVDPRLEAVARKCLAEHPADRPPSAAAVADELDRYLRPPARRLVPVAGVAAAVLLAVALGVWWRPPSPQPADSSARDDEYLGLMNRVRERAAGRPLGWTWANREDLARAAAIPSRYRDPAALRTEVARTFAHPDLREVGTFARGERYEAVAFRPGTEGRQAALGPLFRGERADPSARPRVVLFDRPAGRAVRTWHLPFSGEWEGRRDRTDGTSAVAFTPDGRWLVAATRSGGIYAIDPDADGEPRRLVQERETVKHLFPTPDGTGVVTLALDGRVRRWRVGEWTQQADEQVPTPFPDGWQLTAGLCPLTGDLLVAAPQEKTPGRDDTLLVRFSPHLVRLDESTRRALTRLPAPHPAAPAVAADSHGLQVVAAGHFAAGGLLPRGLDPGLDKYPERVGFTPDGGLLFAGTDSPLVKFWDPAALTPVGQVKGEGGNGCVASAPDAPLLGISDGQCVRLFERSAGAETRVGFWQLTPHAVGLSADGGTLLTATADELTAWGTADGRWAGTRGDFHPDFRPTTPRTLPAVDGGFGVPTNDGLWVVFAERPPRRLAGPPGTPLQPDGRPTANDEAGLDLAAVHPTGVTALTPLADGWVLTGGRDGRVCVCRAGAGALTVEAAVPFDRPVLAVAAAADRATVAVLCEGERQARVWRLDRLNAAWAAAGVGLDLPSPVAVPPPPPRDPPASAAGPGLWAEAHRDRHWGQGWGDPGVRPVRVAGWRQEAAANSPGGPDELSVEWRGWLTPPAGGQYRFRVKGDDRVALFVGGRPVATYLKADYAPAESAIGEADLPPGPTPVRVEYAGAGRTAALELKWSKPGPGGFDWRDVEPKYFSPHPPK